MSHSQLSTAPGGLARRKADTTRPRSITKIAPRRHRSWGSALSLPAVNYLPVTPRA